MRVAPEILAALCQKHGSDLLTPTAWQGTSLDKARLLWGICGVESSFGEHCVPRHENAYCYSGRYFNPAATAQWGCLAHCSFGPWQVMYTNFRYGVSPLSLMWGEDGRVASEVCLVGALDVLNKAIARGTRNLADLVIAYNGPADEEHYSSRLVECWDRPMPGVTAGAVDS